METQMNRKRRKLGKEVSIRVLKGTVWALPPMKERIKYAKC